MLASVGGGLQSIGGGIAKAGAAMTLATAPITAFLATSLKQASDQADALSQLNAVIKSTGGIAGVTAGMANDLADSLSEVTRFSDDAILAGENMLLTFTNIGKDIFPQATKTALNMSQALGQDLKSSAIQLGKALNDPIKGVTALQRVGVTFTDAQKKMIESLVAAGDVMGAQKVILAELEKEFGGSAEAAGTTFAGKMDRLTHKFENFQENIGNLLIPILEKGMDVVSGFIDRIVEWTDANPELTATLVAIAAALVVAGPVLILVGGAISAIATIIPVVAGAFALLTGPIGLVIAAFAALKLAYDNNFLGFKDFVDGIASQLPMLAGRVEVELNTIKLYFDTILGNIWQTVGPALKPLEEWFTKSALPAIIEFVQTKALPALGKFRDFLETFWGNVSASLANLLDWWSNTGAPVISKIIEQRLVPAVGMVISALQNMWTLVRPFVELFAQGMANIFGGVDKNIIQPLIGSLDRLRGTLYVLQQLGSITGLPGMSLFSGAGLSGLPARAAGGLVMAGGNYLIGERGPEVLTMPGNGFITPNSGLRGGGQTVSVEGGIHLHFPNVRDGLDLNDTRQIEAIAGAVLDALTTA